MESFKRVFLQDFNMSLIEKLYPEDEESIFFRDHRWSQFGLLSPKMNYYHNPALTHLAVGDRELLIRQVRNSFFSQGTGDEEIEKRFLEAMNIGIREVNGMCHQFLHFDVSYDNVLQEEIPQPFNLADFIMEGRDITRRVAKDNWERACNKRKSYERLKAFEYAHRVFSINEDPQVIASMIAYQEILKWFDTVLGGFAKKREEDLEYFSRSWETGEGVRVFGNDAPFKSRIKALDSAGNPTYGSMMAKMYDKLTYFDRMDDHIGVTFVTKDEDERKALISGARRESKATMRLEQFKRVQKEDMELVKFNVRVPVPFSYEGRGELVQRIPVEVQVYTLADYEASVNTPGIRHGDYKEERFQRIFPVLFPQAIYGKTLSKFYVTISK